MNSYKFLVIGGGMTADSAARGIRQMDKIGTIALINHGKLGGAEHGRQVRAIREK